MTDWFRVQGDHLDTLTVDLEGIVDLTTVASVAGHVAKSFQPSATLAAVVVPDTLRILVSLTPWLEAAAPGWWLVEWELQFQDGSILTWPDDGKDRIHVAPQVIVV